MEAPASCAGGTNLPLFEQFCCETADEVLDALILERVFSGSDQDFKTWQGLDAAAARLVWEPNTRNIKLSDFAEEFFRRLADQLDRAMLLRKGELHHLVDFADPASIPEEVSAKLDFTGRGLCQSETGRGSIANPQRMSLGTLPTSMPAPRIRARRWLVTDALSAPIC